MIYPAALDLPHAPVEWLTMLILAAVTLMTRRLTRQPIHPTAAAPRPTTAVRAA